MFSKNSTDMLRNSSRKINEAQIVDATQQLTKNQIILSLAMWFNELTGFKAFVLVCYLNGC